MVFYCMVVTKLSDADAITSFDKPNVTEETEHMCNYFIRDAFLPKIDKHKFNIFC